MKAEEGKMIFQSGVSRELMWMKAEKGKMKF